MTAKKFSVIKTFLAAALGATYALSPLLETTAMLYHPVLKIFVAFAMVAIANEFSSGLDYLKTTFLFFLVSFLAGGTAMALNSLGEDFFVISQAKGAVLFFAILSLAIFTKILYFRLRSLLMRGACKLVVRVRMGEKLSETSAILDTGNELTCPFTGKPIIIMNSQALQNILPPELSNVADFTQLASLADSWKSRLQILPYTALGSQGMLVAFKPDKAEIAFNDTNKFTEVHALIGLAKDDFCKDKNYKALVSSQLIPNVGGAVA